MDTLTTAPRSRPEPEAGTAARVLAALSENQTVKPEGHRPDYGLARDITELADRVARLRSRGSRFAGVGLSPHARALLHKSAPVVEPAA